MHGTGKRNPHLRLPLTATAAAVIGAALAWAAADPKNSLLSFDVAAVFAILIALPWATGVAHARYRTTEAKRARRLVDELREAQTAQHETIEQLGAERWLLEHAREANDSAWRVVEDALNRAHRECEELARARDEWSLNREAELLRAFALGLKTGRSESLEREGGGPAKVLDLDMFRAGRDSPDASPATPCE